MDVDLLAVLASTLSPAEYDEAGYSKLLSHDLAHLAAADRGLVPYPVQPPQLTGLYRCVFTPDGDNPWKAIVRAMRGEA